jgi:hypothetical protein
MSTIFKGERIMKRIATILIMTTLGAAPLCAMPSQINFQGTLKQQGVPVNAPPAPLVTLHFIFLDAPNGNQIQGNNTSFDIPNVTVTNGLFSVQLPIDQSVPWEQYNTPYIRVSVNGQNLSPDQPLNANLYAVSAIPQGMIAMFAGPCPTGWSSFAPLNNNNAFPMGGTSYDGTLGGAATVDTGQGFVFAVGQGPGSFVTDWRRAVHGTSPQPGLSSTVSNLPPYVTMVFCQKL